MNLTGEAKLVIGVILSVIVLIGAVVTLAPQPKTTAYTYDELVPQGSAIRGNVNQNVYLVEFSDFQCPACGAYKPTVDELIAQYGDKFTFVYRHFPLPQHQYGEIASEAFEASGEQGKSWEMYSYLFENQKQFSESFIMDAAAKFGLDNNKYQESIKNKKFNDKIQRDISDGQRFGVSGTPTFFLNGVKLNLSSPNQLKLELEKKIKEG